MNSRRDFWCGKKVLLTGHTGFKGSWLSIWLRHLGADVTGIALVPNTTPSLFALARLDRGLSNYFCDIRDSVGLSEIIRKVCPEIVFHLAAQPLVRASYLDPLGTFATNIMGTAHLLEALRGQESIKVAVLVTTDKVYRNNEWIYPYRETDALGGYDPYSASKAASEIIISSYKESFLNEQGVAVATVRAGNVIGGGDWSQDRLIPDAVKSWQAAVPLEIRRPNAIRPWQHVLDPLNGYLALAEKLWKHPEFVGAYNFGPLAHEAATVKEVIQIAIAAYGTGEFFYGDGDTGPHEASWLTLDTSKARHSLGIIPIWSLSESIKRTMVWYRAQQQGVNAYSLCEADIAAYESIE